MHVSIKWHSTVYGRGSNVGTLSISVSEMRTLNPDYGIGWIEDKPINAYINIINAHRHTSDFIALQTFGMSKLMKPAEPIITWVAKLMKGKMLGSDVNYMYISQKIWIKITGA